MHHAHGTFTVKLTPLAEVSAEGISRYSLEKEFHGDLEGASKGEMIGAGDLAAGKAGYVAMEVVTGTLNGKQGSFALQHSGTMNSGAQNMDIQVVPGSGTGALKDIFGRLVIRIENRQHFYDLDYTLPE
jgi:hypothetical protein